ncbi:MAG: enoyl-CoA hydratase/isomerase family protein [Microthrixaceae bacterium]
MTEHLSRVIDAPDPLLLTLEGVSCTGEDLVALEGRTAPSIAVVRGACSGAALAAAVSVDLLVCAPGATFGSPGAWSPWVMRRGEGIMGRRAVGYLVMTGRRISADTAHEWGLVSYISPEPEAFASVLVERLASQSKVAVKTIMAQAHRGAVLHYMEVLATNGFPEEL